MKAVFLYLILSAVAGASDLVEQWYDTVEQARVLQTQGQYQDSLKLLRIGLGLARQVGPDDVRVAVTLNNLGHLYQDLGRYQEALDAYTAAKRLILRRKDLPDSFKMVNGFNLVMLYIETGKAKKADDLCKKSFYSLVATMPANHPYRAELLATIAATHLVRKRYAEADSFYTLANAVYSSASDDIEKALSFSNRARARAQLGRFDEARADVANGIAIFEKAVGRPDHPLLARFYHDVAATSAKLQDPPQTEIYFRKALDVAERAFGPGSTVHTSILMSYANTLRDWHRVDEARTLRRSALDSYVPRRTDTVAFPELFSPEGRSR